MEKLMRYRLTRLDDGKEMLGTEVTWISFNSEGKGFSTKREEDIVPGASCVLSSLYGIALIWQTTLVDQVIENTPTYKKFTTKNSLYELRYEENRSN